MLLFSLCVSVSYILGALVANDIEPGAITAARFFIGAIVMGTLLFLSKNLRKWTSQNHGDFCSRTKHSHLFCINVRSRTASSLSLAVVFLPPSLHFFLNVFKEKSDTQNIPSHFFVGRLGDFEGNLENLLAFKIGYGELLFFGAVLDTRFMYFDSRSKQGEHRIPNLEL